MKYFLNPVGAALIAMLIATSSCNNQSAENTSGYEAEASITATDPVIAPAADTAKKIQGEDKFLSIKTSEGVIKVTLYKECPLHQANFMKLAGEKFYDGVLFHRVIKGFMIQTGDPDSKAATPGGQYGSGGPGYTIPAEINPLLHHKKGALAAARQGDEVNPYRASSGSQFYICQGRVMPKDQLMQMGKPFSEQAIKDYSTIGGTPELDGDYTVFGAVTSGLEIVDKIANVQTLPGDRPKKDIKILSISVDTKQ